MDMKVNNIINISFQNGINKSNQVNEGKKQPSNIVQPNEEKNKYVTAKKILPYAAGTVGIITLIALTVAAVKRGRVPRPAETLKGSLLQEDVQTSIKPEYLFHMTSKENYDSICADGVIRKSVFGDGVFLSDKDTIKNKYDDITLERMIKWYGGYMPQQGGPVSDSHKVVILRMQVKPEEESLYKWRPIKLLGADNSGLTDEWINFTDIGKEELNALWSRPVEFLHCGEIPAGKCEKIAEIDLAMLTRENFVSRFKELTNV